MSKDLVYDLPTRLFHWLFAGLFLTAFVIAKTIDDDSSLFAYHSLAGLTLGFLVLLRVLWGYFGTRHARFSDFSLKPSDLYAYTKGIISGAKDRWAGHNPASSWVSIVMMSMAVGLAVTGYQMTSGSKKEAFEDAHELLANGFVILVILHIAGIALHTLRHKEMIGLSMIDGKKSDVPKEQVIDSSKSGFGLLLAVLVLAFGAHLLINYDTKNRTLQFFGFTLTLGENEQNEVDGAENANEKEDLSESSDED